MGREYEHFSTMETLSVRVKKGTKERIERQVKARGYKNSSEVLRKIIEEHFEEHPEIFATDELAEIIKEAEKSRTKSLRKSRLGSSRGRRMHQNSSAKAESDDVTPQLSSISKLCLLFQ